MTGRPANAPELAAYAASSKYPTTQASGMMQAAALVSRDGNTIRIINFTDQPMRDVNVWVNGGFVHKVAYIPPNGTVNINRNQFYNQSGESLSGMNTSATKVQLETNNQLHNIAGPVFEE